MEVLGIALGKVLRQQRDILDPLAQRRQVHGEHLEADQEHMPQVINAMARFAVRLAEYAVENPEICRICARAGSCRS